MSRKNISLNRAAMVSLAVGYSVILVLLCCMDLLLILNRQSGLRKETERRVQSAADTVSDDLSSLSVLVYDVYANDDNFKRLADGADELPEYDSVYELDANLKNKALLDGRLSGYFLFYRNGRRARYYYNNQKISAADAPHLKETLAATVSGVSGVRQWFLVTLGGRDYLCLTAARKAATICAVYSLQSAKRAVLEPAGGGAQALVIADRSVQSEPDAVALYGLRERAQQAGAAVHYTTRSAGVFLQPVSSAGIWLALVQPITFWQLISLPQLLLVALTLASVGGALAAYRALRRQLVRPLRALVGVMTRIQDGDWEAVADTSGVFTEIRDVGETLNTMVAEIQKQKLLSYEQTIEKQKARMQYLMLQLKPHFYLNGLKTLNAMAMNNDTAHIQEFIMSLSFHLRYLLQTERELVTLGEELDYVRNYCTLQKNMTGRPFSVDWELRAEPSWPVPPLCLQTFFENSFKYARLGSAQNELFIRVSADVLETEQGRFLNLQVSDNGSGYPDDMLGELNGEPGAGGRSVGVANLKRRCGFLYGEQAEFDFYNDGGAVSVIILPEKAAKVTN